MFQSLIHQGKIARAGKRGTQVNSFYEWRFNPLFIREKLQDGDITLDEAFPPLEVSIPYSSGKNCKFEAFW